MVFQELISAALMGEYGGEKISIIIYGATLVLAGLAFNAIWVYVSTNYRLIDQRVDPKIIKLGSKVVIAAPIIYLIAVITAFINPL